MSSGEEERSSGSGSSSPRHQTSESNSSSSMQVSMSPGEEQKRSNSRSSSGSGSGSSSPSNCGSSSENGSSGSHVSGGGSSKSHNSKGSNADSNGSHSSGGGSTSTGNSDSQHSDSTTISKSTAPHPRSEQQQQQQQQKQHGWQEQDPSFPSSVRLIPRQRFSFNSPIVYTYDMLKARFHLRLPDAAKSLGISETTLKHVCRKLGVARWPRRVQNRNCAEPESACAQASGADPRGRANCNGDSDDGAPHASEKRKRSPQAQAGQSTSSSLPPHLIHHTNAQAPHVSSLLQQQSMASHQLLATQRQTAAGCQGFTAGVDGAVVGVQMPSLLGREGFGGAAARTVWRMDTGVSDKLFSCMRTVSSPCLTQSRDLQGRTDVPALNAQAHITREQGASQSEVDYHLDLQALQEHTAFPPLSALLAHRALAQGGRGDY
jgi:hypothetical protein